VIGHTGKYLDPQVVEIFLQELKKQAGRHRGLYALHARPDYVVSSQLKKLVQTKFMCSEKRWSAPLMITSFFGSRAEL